MSNAVAPLYSLKRTEKQMQMQMQMQMPEEHAERVQYDPYDPQYTEIQPHTIPLFVDYPWQSRVSAPALSATENRADNSRQTEPMEYRRI